MKRKIVLILIGLMIIALSFAFVACKEGETNEANVVVEENGDVVLTLKADDETVIYELKKEDINYVRSFDHPYKGKNVYTWTASIEGVGEIKIIEDGKIVSVDALLNLISDGLSHALSIYPTTYYTKLFLNGAAYKAVQGKVPEAITAIPEKDYRVFKGFSVNSEGKDIIVTDKNGKFIGEWQYDYNELTLNPEYDLASISLNLDYGHDREKDADVPDIVQIGSELNYLRLLGLEGHNFLGWYSDDNVRLVDEKGSFIYGATLTDENASAFGVTKTGNGYVLNIKANWEPKKYKVYLFYNGVQVGEPEVTYGEVIGESLDLNAINIGESYCELLWEGYDLLKKMPSVEIRLNVKEVFHHTDADGKRIWECISGKCVRCNKTINAYVNHNLDSTAPCADKTCAICGTIFPSEAEHEFSESVIGVSCVDKACLVCGYVEEKTAEHVLDEAGLPDCRCKNCGKNLINDIGYYRQGSKVYYGSYPTTLLTEDKDAVTLRKLATDRPTFDNDNGWTAFDYGTTDDFSNVWYKDVVLDSEKYRGIYIDNGYRENNDYQRANGYSLCNTYWFRYEALSWTIVDEIDGKVTLISDRILDAGNATDAESIFASFSEVVFGGNTNECFESAALPTAQIAATVTDYAKAMGIKTENVRLLTEGDLSAENCSGILPVIRMELFPHRNVFTIKADRGIKYFYYRVGTTGEFEISSTSISFPVDEKDYVYYKSVADYGYTVDDDMRNLYVRENKNYTLTLTPTPLNVDISLVGDETFAVDLTVEATFDDGVEITALPQREYYHLIGFYDENNVKVIDSTGKFVDAAEGIVEGGALKKAEPFTLFAKWDLNMYAIYFDGEGGVGDTASFAFVNASEKELPRSSFEKEGYGFAGWNTSGSNEVEYEDGALVYGVDLISALGLSLYDNDSATLKAVWTPNKYVVRFDKNGGSGVQMADEEFVYDVEKVLTKNEYVKTGYVFAGWTYAQNVYADCAKVNNLTSEENAVVTLLAEWDPISYYIEFSAGNGEGDMQKVECVYDTQSTLPKNAFVKTGYVFDRWTCGDMNYADEATIGNLSEVDEAELTFTATWRPCVYTVAYSPAYEGCETTMEPSSLVYDTAIELRANSFEREGYEFIGWSLSETGEIEFEDKASVINLATTDGSVVTLYARWVNNRYTIVYHGNLDGAEDFSATHVYDVSSALAVNTYSKKGYSFAGWDENRLAKQGKYASGEYVANLTSTPDGKVDLYAIWSPIKYTVAYYANGGVGNTYSSSHYYDKSQRLTACKFSLAGYAFVGWSESPDGEPIYTDMQSVVNLRENEDDVVNLYAVWTANDYTVKYVANGGDGQMANTPAKVDVSFNLRENTFIKAGYTFAGWNTYSNAETALYADGETVVNLTLDPSAEFSLYAVWTANDYKVYYAANGGSLPDGQTMDYSTFTYGKRGTLKKNVYYKTGYSFDGWTLNDNVYDNEASVLNLSEGENVTLTAKWSPNTYTVNFLSNGGSGVEMASEEFAYDEEKALTLCSYNRIGYTFVGWALSANGEAIYDDGQEVINLTADSNAALNIYAVWSANTYTIKFNANSGVGSTPSQPFVYDGAQALNACGYTKVGYHFIGWALSSGGEKVYSNGETVINVTAIDKATVDLYAVWENNTYSFAYHANGGVGETYIQTFTYDVKGYVSDCNFTKTGYHFVGWGESADSVEPAYSTGDEIFNLTANDGAEYSFYALWAKNTYTVNYHANGGVGETYFTTQTYDVEFTLSVNPFTKLGYHFIGWDLDQNVLAATYSEGQSVSNLTAVNNGAVDFYAIWANNTFTFEYLPNGGNGKTYTQTFTYDVKGYVSDCNFTKTGYHFVGWGETADSVEPAYSTGDEIFNLTVTDGVEYSLYALWDINSYDLTLSVKDEPSGSVSGEGRYAYQQTVTITATSNIGYYFVGWFDGNTNVSSDKSYTLRIPANDLSLVANFALCTTHTPDEDCICTKCGKEAHYKTVNESGFCRHGDYVYFGTYPQTIKADDIIITNTIDSHGYYLGSDGEYYVKVTTNPYPYDSNYTFSTGESLIKGKICYFKVEVIKWRIITESDDNVLILCDNIIATHNYYENIIDRTINGETIYANNYKESDIRAWLNDEFYSTAFNDLQRELIKVTNVNNSVISTMPNGVTWNNGSNEYACSNSNDKIFLLSEQEVTMSIYGFKGENVYSPESNRCRLTSDYSRATGAFMSKSSDYYGNGKWWLRSPCYYTNDSSRIVYVSGIACNSENVADKYTGVVPALRLSLCMHMLDEECVCTICGTIQHKLNEKCICTACGTAQHSINDECVCSVCGETVHGIRDGGYCRHESCIYFGTYPQTIKADNVNITDTIDSRGYYLGSDGEYYAKVIASPKEHTYTFSTGAKVSRGTVYYFKVEPIKWQILSENNGEAFIICDSIIANKAYYYQAENGTTRNRTAIANYNDDYYAGNGSTVSGSVYDNNYLYSDVRKWLNETFYDVAFNSLQKGLIQVTNVDNSARTTNPANNSTEWNSGNNQYACSNTNDKIFLLSEQEVTTSYNENGFNKTYNVDDDLRKRKTSDYSRATGIYMSTDANYYGNSIWCLRSPYYGFSHYARGVYPSGDANDFRAVGSMLAGVVPALKINFCPNGHTYNGDSICIVCGTAWSVNTDDYYVVGLFSGGTTDNWEITEANIKLDDPCEEGIIAQKENIHLNAGDQVKVRKGSGDWLVSWSDSTTQFTNGGSIFVNTTGTYGIYVKYEHNDWHFYIVYKG